MQIENRRTHAVRAARVALGALLAVLSGACSLERHPIVAPRHLYTATAQVWSGDGPTLRLVTVNSDDMTFAGGAPPVLATIDGVDPFTGLTAEQRLLDQWARYLKRRLEDPAASPEFRARFGAAPFCLSAASVRRTEAVSTAPPLAETGDPLTSTACTGRDTCGNPPGIVPALEVSPPATDFGPTPVGASTPDATVTLANAGAGRLCLDAPRLDPLLSANPGDFTLDVTDCAPLPGEGQTVLDTTRPSCSVRLRFTPADPGPRRAVLRVTSSDPARPVADVAVAGQGQPGVLRATPSPFCPNAVTVTVGGRTCHRNTLNLVNDGPGAVTIGSATLPTTDEASGDWAKGFPSGAPPVTVAPGGTYPVALRGCDGAPDSAFTVGSNAAAPVLEVPLPSPDGGCTP